MTNFSKKFCAKSPFKDNPDTIDTTLADNVYSKDKVDRTLINLGYDPASRKIYGKTGLGGKIPKNPIQTQGPTLSDATLIILTSKNNPVIEVRFKDLFPTSLTGLTYDQQADDVNYLTATVSFEYLNYEFATVNSSRTTVTTSQKLDFSSIFVIIMIKKVNE